MLDVLPSYCGDASGEGTLSASDALLILNSSVGIGVCNLRVCDTNRNGLVTATDALAVLRYLIGLASQLDCAGRKPTPDLDDGIVVTTTSSSTTIFVIPICGNGTREPGELCDDGNLLDGDCCSSICRRAPTSTPCDDGNPCTTGDGCLAGACHGTEVLCDDSNECTLDACNPINAACVNFSFVVCDDDNLCTTESCNETTGDCDFLPTDCSDGLACTSDDCEPETGACSHGPLDCEDADLCTVDSCDEGANGCVHELMICSDGDTCTDDLCDAIMGICLTTPVDCSDGDPCTTDSCNDQTGCTHVPIDCSLLDGPCTVGKCDAATGVCASEPTSGTRCDDGDPCTTDDACNASGTCVSGGDVDCSHLDAACTTGTCNLEGECVSQPKPGSSCSDGDPCTVGDACDLKGICAPGTALDCSLVDTECATGTCDETGVCVAIPDPAKSCDDRNACTLDSCDPASGCSSNPSDELCDDGTFCNGMETCSAETGCVAGVLPNCDDGNPCTVDTCSDEAVSCLHDPAAGVGMPCETVGPCGDGGLCNAIGVCEPLTTVHEMDVIDFEDLPAGSVLTSVTGNGGNGPIGVTGTNPNFPSATPAAIIFNSACTRGCSGGDADLGTPNAAYGGPGSGSGGGPASPFPNTVAQGNVAIVAENLVDANVDGLIDDPDDQADTPVELLFDFSALDTVTVYELTIIDIDIGEVPPLVELLGSVGERVGTFNGPSTGNNGVALIDLGSTAGVAAVRIKLSCSGAVDDLVFSVETCDDADGGGKIPPSSCGP